ncbi:MAG TPA: PEGA domain-containing protein [Polyangiaceae bacterium]
MKHHRITIALAGVALVCTTMARGAYAADPERVAEGRAHFSRGVDYFKDEDYRNAMVEFKRAYELAPNYKLLYNLGQTGQELKDYAFALKSLERYLADGGADVPADRRTEVAATIRKLKQRVAEITINTDVSDADILVDDVPVGRTPLTSPLVVSAGHRKITLTKGPRNATRTVEVSGGERAELSLELTSAEPSGDPQRGESNSPPTEATKPSKTKPHHENANVSATSQPTEGGNSTWIGLVVTGVLAAATGVTGGLALAAKSDFDATVDKYPVAPGDVRDARSKTRSLALATDILGGATLVSGGITVWMALSSGHSTSNEANRVGFTLTPTGVVARGTF